FSGSAWISVATGCGPGRCGVYSRYQLNSGTYDVGRVTASDCRVKPFWTSFKGPIVTIDVPKVPLVPQPDGFQVVEWGAYDHYSEFSTYPPGLAKRILDEFGDHPFRDDNFEVKLHQRRDFATLRALLIEGVAMKQRLTADLMKSVQPRFLLSAFGETHAAGHAFWRFQDPHHPSYEEASPYCTALRDVYRAIDDAIGEILQELGENCILVILSSQGFCLDSMADEDFLQKFLTTTKLSVPRLALTKYAAYTPGLTLDTTRSKAFCLPTDLQGYIRVNLKGREPDGWVSDGEYDVVCQEIESELLALRHNDLDVPVVKEVVRVRDRLNGSFLDRLPDLSVIWNCDRVVSEVQSPTCGRLAFAPDLSAGGGNHRGVGFALIYGCGVRQGRFGGNVFDMAPTIANWLQEESRPEWEGHILNIAGLEEPSR
ncbi:MAG TPA: alkaline phosphatase family protein, partial [Terriglobales bacterium]|nr:alkaline phosphatase family protein [Terriglobales bacterium]